MQSRGSWASECEDIIFNDTFVREKKFQSLDRELEPVIIRIKSIKNYKVIRKGERKC